MEDIKSVESISINDTVYNISVWNQLGISKQYFLTLLSRDEYSPTLSKKPDSTTVSYIDPASGNSAYFHEGQCVTYPDTEVSDGVGLSICKKLDYGSGTVPESVLWLHISDSEKVNSNPVITEIKYKDLVQLQDTNKLIPGNLYRITDYETIVNDDINENVRSAGHPFDVIVTALSSDTLSEKASVIQSNRDGGYFKDCQLNAWQIWYCLDNDISRFAWAHTSKGKGVIYRMIDEWGNDVPYDFKNIQFKRCRVLSDKTEKLHDTYVGIPEIWFVDSLTCVESDFIWCYTFSKRKYQRKNYEEYDLEEYDFYWEIDGDLSVLNRPELEYAVSGIPCHNNIIKPCSVGENKFILNNIVFLDGWLDKEHSYYRYITKTSGNTFGENCYDFTFLGLCYENNFGSDCNTNVFGYYCYQNTFQNSVQQNTFGYDFIFNTFAEYVFNNTFINAAHSNTFGTEVALNTFGENFRYNTFGNVCTNNTFGSDCKYNTFGNTIDFNTFGDDCTNNTFGNSIIINTFGSDCKYNTFGNNIGSNTFGNNFQYNIVENGIKYVVIPNENVYYVHILAGTGGTNSYKKLTINFEVNKAYSQYAGLNSSGELKIWVPSDGETESGNTPNFWFGTEIQFKSLGTYDSNTLYHVLGTQKTFKVVQNG